MSAIVAGGISGAAMCLLAAQFAVLYPTRPVTTTFVAMGAAAAGLLRCVSRRSADSRSDRACAYALIPDGGLDAYTTPDTSQPAAAHLDPDLEVAVVERWGDWTLVRCSNDWTGWVDGRKLKGEQDE